MKKIFVFLIALLIIFLSFSDVHGQNCITEFHKENFNLSDTERNEKDVFGHMKKILSNDNLEFYLKEDEDLFAVLNKKNNFIWWSSPVNAWCDETATDSVKYSLKSSLSVSYHKNKDSVSNSLKSAKSADISYILHDNSLEAVYDFKNEGIIIPVVYSLGEDFLQAEIFSECISESENLIDEITVMGSFGAGSENENGYFIIPDGCGAVINFNNGKTDAKEYFSVIYGKDLTAVPEKIPSVNSQVNLPLYAVVKDNNGVLAVIHQGDENASLNASVSVQSKSMYNRCFFSFIMRGSDTYYIGNEKNPVTVFENNHTVNKKISLRYYILSDENLSCCRIAERYRDYLSQEYGLGSVDCSGSSQLYIDVYGGSLKKKSFSGIPVYQKTSFTSFSQAEEIIRNIDCHNITVSYDNWTDNSISGRIDFSAVPSETLGGKNDFYDFKEFIDNSDSRLYPVCENIKFLAGNGFHKFSDASLRISGSFAEIPSYDYAYGIKDKFRKNFFLISPENLTEIYYNSFSSYSNAGIENISLGKVLSVLYGDYGKNIISRGDMKNIVIDFLKNKDNMSVLAEYPNAYALPYIDCISDVPLCSGKYDIFDYDIPFYQMVIHGVIPYSSTSVNSSPNPQSELLKAVLYGSAIKYDIIYEDSYKLKDTEADIYFYGKYNSINQDYKKVSDIISRTQNCTITDFVFSDDEEKTYFSDGSVLILKDNILSPEFLSEN